MPSPSASMVETIQVIQDCLVPCPGQGSMSTNRLRRFFSRRSPASVFRMRKIVQLEMIDAILFMQAPISGESSSR